MLLLVRTSSLHVFSCLAVSHLCLEQELQVQKVINASTERGSTPTSSHEQLLKQVSAALWTTPLANGTWMVLSGGEKLSQPQPGFE